MRQVYVDGRNESHYLETQLPILCSTNMVGHLYIWSHVSPPAIEILCRQISHIVLCALFIVV